MTTRSTPMFIGSLASLRRRGMLVAVAEKIEGVFKESGGAVFLEPTVTLVTALGPADEEGFVPCLAGRDCVFIDEDDLVVVPEKETACSEARASADQRPEMVLVEAEWDLF